MERRSIRFVLRYTIGCCAPVVTVAIVISCRVAVEIPQEGDAREFLADAACLPPECGCTSVSATDGYACSDANMAWVDEAQAAGLSFDGACLRRLMVTTFDIPEYCTPEPPDVAPIPCEEYCQVYSGRSRLNSPCERHGSRISTCEQGLICALDGRCRLPCEAPTIANLNQACGYEQNGLFDTPCAEGLICHPAMGFCVVASAIDEPCDSEAPVCEADAWCDPTTRACAPTIVEGAACTQHVECATGICDGVCAPADPYLCSHPWL